MVEEFGLDHDATAIDQQAASVEIHDPDGRNDALQQIEHGLLSVLGGYRAMGRLYRGIIEPTLRQYVHLGDAATMTDNVFRKPVSGLGNDNNGNPIARGRSLGVHRGQSRPRTPCRRRPAPPRHGRSEG